MRAIEKRIAAVEDRQGSKDGSTSLRVFLPGCDGDLTAFRQRWRTDGVKCVVIRFVKPGDANSKDYISASLI